MVAVQVEAYRDARPWEVVVRLASDDTVRGLNATFRHKDKPTNVLSFPNEDDGLEARWTVGDIVLAQSVVEAEAADQHKPLANHARHLLLHGLLHLVGYDHMTDDDARTMEVLEARLLATLGIPNPYAGDKT
ncbi:MAG: rRNA maturation RNase YbeY [Pseudomonadaceae bacterium]|nr:rRNA maturation RNase YbeY [Pseudomonadaceae bacterium]